jgi:hypothetical protein
MKVDRKSRPVARRVQKRGQKKRAHYTSAGSAHLMQLESRLEASAAIAMGLDPRVSAIRSQPVTFDIATGRTYASAKQFQEAKEQYGLKGKAYTPDFAVKLNGKEVLVEVKHSALIEEMPQILNYPSLLARYGYRLVILDDTVLTDVYTRNLRLLHISWKTSTRREAVSHLLDACANQASYGQVLTEGVDPATVLTSIAIGDVTCDIRTARLNHDTMITASGDTATHLKELPLVGV